MGISTVAARWGAFVARNRWQFLFIWLLLFAVAVYLASGTAVLLSPLGQNDTESARASRLVRENFPERRAPALYVVFHSDQVAVDDPEYQAQVAGWQSDLTRLSTGTSGVVTGPLVSRDRHTSALIVESNDPDSFMQLAHTAAGLTHRGPARAYVGGLGAVYDDYVQHSERDLQQSERLSLPIAFLLLLLVFGGLVAGLLPVFTGLVTVTSAVALLGIAARAHTVSIFSLNVTSVIGLGLGIDYSLLFVNRFREELRSGSAVEDAVAVTMSTAGVATLVSGATVAIGFGALTISRLNMLWSMGLGGALVVAVSVAASLTLIPAMLTLFGRHVDSLTIPWPERLKAAGLWQQLANKVMARPLMFIAFALGLSLLLFAPARNIRLGVTGAESLPPDDPAVQAAQLARSQLGLPDHLPVLVVASGVSSLSEAADVERRLRSSAEGQPVHGPVDVPPSLVPLYLRNGHALYEVEQPAGNNDERTHRWLERIQATSWPSGVRVLLGGEAPAYHDFLLVLQEDAARILAVVLALTLVLLAAAFRSIALPIKAVLMNLLSVAAALGVLTWVFQEGNFASQLQFQRIGFVESTVPVILFAGLFGLSMDYEVFLLTRIREEWLKGLDNRRAVAVGLERTGRIITSAALILVAVVGTLIFSHLSLNKGFGITFAIAILLDATVIRLLLVPAMMRVLGNLNWWPGTPHRSPLIPAAGRKPASKTLGACLNYGRSALDATPAAAPHSRVASSRRGRHRGHVAARQRLKPAPMLAAVVLAAVAVLVAGPALAQSRRGTPSPLMRLRQFAR